MSESTVRGDYEILEGTNRHTLTPTGWVQEEDNLKLNLDEQGQPDADVPYLARELGVARYEHVVDFDFSAGDAYWQRTGAFWRDVRAAWDSVYAERDSFEYLEQADGEEMFVPLFPRPMSSRMEVGEEEGDDPGSVYSPGLGPDPLDVRAIVGTSGASPRLTSAVTPHDAIGCLNPGFRFGRVGPRPGARV